MGRAHTHTKVHASEDQEGGKVLSTSGQKHVESTCQALPHLCHDTEVLLDFISPTCALKIFFLGYKPEYGSCFSC